MTYVSGVSYIHEILKNKDNMLDDKKILKGHLFYMFFLLSISFEHFIVVKYYMSIRTPHINAIRGSNKKTSMSIEEAYRGG